MKMLVPREWCIVCCNLGLLWIYVLTPDLELGLTSLMNSDALSPKKQGWLGWMFGVGC